MRRFRNGRNAAGFWSAPAVWRFRDRTKRQGAAAIPDAGASACVGTLPRSYDWARSGTTETEYEGLAKDEFVVCRTTVVAIDRCSFLLPLPFFSPTSLSGIIYSTRVKLMGDEIGFTLTLIRLRSEATAGQTPAPSPGERVKLCDILRPSSGLRLNPTNVNPAR